ncbi:MAG: hypothetical protein DRI86_11910 [Bacteroidetes bacterium]|nr:MAG: hypothetical protein DRI86_11910 [Bacteroidota bacterium]
MKFSQLILLITLFLFTLFNSCKKDEKPTQVEIKYILHDDVSPVNAKIFCNKNLSYAKWKVDSNIYELYYQDTLDYVFEHSGISNVELIAEGLRNEVYNSSIDIPIPKIARKLRIYGFLFTPFNDINIVEDSVELKIEYYDNGDSVRYKYCYSKSELLSQDTIIFSNHIVLNIGDFEEWDDDYQILKIVFYGKNSNNCYASLYSDIEPLYFNQRMNNPKIVMSCDSTINLMVDWAL